MTSVRFSGPLFSGAIQRQVRQAIDRGTYEAAKHGQTLIRARFSGVLKHPTGHLSSQVSIQRGGEADYRLGDGGVIYGPWIEGVGSRNSPVTRFAGYRTYRAVTQDLDRGGAVSIVQEAITRAL